MENINVIGLVQPKYDVNIDSPTTIYPSSLIDETRYKIDFDIVLNNGKKLQRGFVWSLEQKQELIVTILKGHIKIPNIHAVVETINENKIDEYQVFKVVDGKQRLNAIFTFINNEYPITINGVDYYFDNFDTWSKHRILKYPLSIHIRYEYWDDKVSDNELISWFEMVNYSGTPQELEHLNYLKGDNDNTK